MPEAKPVIFYKRGKSEQRLPPVFPFRERPRNAVERSETDEVDSQSSTRNPPAEKPHSSRQSLDTFPFCGRGRLEEDDVSGILNLLTLGCPMTTG